MRRTATLAALVLSATLVLSLTPATADRPADKVISREVTLRVGERFRSPELQCPPGYFAVYGQARRRGPNGRIYESRAVGKDEWVFSLENPSMLADATFVIELHCVKVPPRTFDVVFPRAKRVRPGEAETTVVRCDPGFAPFGWGYKLSEAGPPRGDPPENAGVRLFLVNPSPGQFTFGFEGAGLEPLDVTFPIVCLDRHRMIGNRAVDLTVTRREFPPVEVGFDDEVTRLLRCPRGTVPGAPGWILQPREATFIEEEDLAATFTKLRMLSFERGPSESFRLRSLCAAAEVDFR